MKITPKSISSTVVGSGHLYKHRTVISNDMQTKRKKQEQDTADKN